MTTKSGDQTLESMSQAVWYNQRTLKKFDSYLKGDILEVGCGIGNFTKSLTQFGRVWAFDINKNHLQETKKKIKQNIRVGFGDIEKGKYFFGKEKFDVVVCLNVLEHIKDDQQAIKNIYHLLKLKGILILLVPIHPFLYGEIDRSIGHLRRYHPEEIKEKLLQKGFSILKMRKLNFLGALGWFIAGKILKEKVVKSQKIDVFNFVAPLVLPIEDRIEPPLGTSILVIAKKR